jgi:predicted Rossmann fold nucleotide-binding protein DprA/Smf involved in DNA uptake
MSNFLTDDTKAIILLCGFFGKSNSAHPLSQGEYNALVRWLMSADLRPKDLLQNENIGPASIGSGIYQQRLESLLGRGVQLGFAVEEWQRNGIWIISRSDDDYPARYKSHLKDIAPPLLFGVGDRSLLRGGGLAVVGSRNVDETGEVFTRRIGELCAQNRMPVVSGGARGVDQFAMTASLEAGGVTIGVLADNLLKTSLERNSRKAISEGRLLLISHCHPNARFTVGTAMGRNKLIYAMADYGLVVSAEYKKGGTWAGAEEELKRECPIPVFVRMEEGVPSGNKKLLELGAVAWPEKSDQTNLKTQLGELSVKSHQQKKTPKNMSLFEFQETQKTSTDQTKNEERAETIFQPDDVKDSIENNSAPTVYETVLPVILDKLQSPSTLDELSQALDVVKPQLNVWLKKALDEKKVVKLSRPVRYQRLRSEERM